MPGVTQPAHGRAELRASHSALMKLVLLTTMLDLPLLFSLSSADDTILILKIILEDKCELEAKKQENFEMSPVSFLR